MNGVISSTNDLLKRFQNVSSFITCSIYRNRLFSFPEKLNLEITSEKKHTPINEHYLKSASGDYVFQYLFNQVPMFIRNRAYNRSYVSVDYMLWYADEEWRLQGKKYNEDWDKGKVLFRKKSKCKFQNAK